MEERETRPLLDDENHLPLHGVTGGTPGSAAAGEERGSGSRSSYQIRRTWSEGRHAGLLISLLPPVLHPCWALGFPPAPSLSVEVRNSPLHPLPLQQGNIKVLNIMEGLLEVNGWGGGRGGDRDKGRAWGWTGRGLLPPPVRPVPPCPLPSQHTHMQLQ